MIFTQLSENNIVFNEADSKKKLTMDRTEFLKKVAKLIKSELGPDLEECTTFRTDKDYGKNDFIECKCEFVTVAHVKKSAEPYIGNQADNAKAILDMLNRMANKINTKIPSDCRVTPKYKGDPNGDQWDGWDINLTVPQNKNEFLSESYTGGGNMIFTECSENNIVFNEASSNKDRDKVLKTATSLIKSMVDPTIKKHIKFVIDKKDKDEFLSGQRNDLFIAMVNAWDIVGNARAESDKVADLSVTLYNNCQSISKKLPDGYTLEFGGDWDDWSIDLKAQSIKNESNIVVSSGNNGGTYLYDSLYESYIQTKIDAEERLALALKESMVISESDYSNIRAIQEAKIGDKIKNTWKKFIAFIKSLFAKFMESLTNLLLDEKGYLEKYKDIILRKKPKEDMEYSYTGNYEKGISRLTNTTVPMFDYYKYKKAFDAEGDGELVKAIMSGTNFSYDDGETLAEQFKSYFLALEDGQQEGKFSSLNMTNIYNFCYNFNKVKGIVDKDIARLEASTRSIENAINRELDASAESPETDKVESAEESAVFTEAEEKAKSTGLKIDASTDPTNKMGSTQNRDNDAEKNAATAGAAVAKEDNKESSDITKAADKWITVCRPLIAAKMTACQQIAKDYMEIIRAHVRSYGGADKKSKEGNKAPDKGKKYSNNADVEKAKKEAEDAKKEADKT